MSTLPRKQPDTPASASARSDQTHASARGTEADPVEGQSDVDHTPNVPGDAEGDTEGDAEELARKVDVPTRVKDELHDTAESVQAKVGR
jgi:hypothetical protein